MTWIILSAATLTTSITIAATLNGNEPLIVAPAVGLTFTIAIITLTRLLGHAVTTRPKAKTDQQSRKAPCSTTTRKSS